MFWKKKKPDQNLDTLIDMIKILMLKVDKHENQITLINAKLRMKLYKNVPEEKEQQTDSEKTIYNDGFDEIRRINQNG